MSSEELYQEFILELYKNPINFGKLESQTHHAESYNPLCGDKVELFLKIENNQVTKATFIGSGCAISQATTSLLTEEIKGKTMEELKKMQKDDILKVLKIDLSKNPSRLKCALLSLEVLKKAIA